MTDSIGNYVENYVQAAIENISKQVNRIEITADVAREIVRRIENSEVAIYWFGNGGSASDAEHLAAELSGRFAIDRIPLRSIALTSNSSAVTAIANDYGFENVFARQVEGAARRGDVVIGITTSGNSENVIRGLRAAKNLDCLTVVLTGTNVNNFDFVDYVIAVESLKTCHIQEAHILLGQAICGAIESKLFS
jgi:D-sedoheptulose 7-phosphate isomerase